jgi:2-keto-4-pentenoate hydratase/2-oxohepta-3-ene-1,7-dioic acid hydratase in catechol pathway
MNDVSQRNIQNGDRSGWFRGKSLDTFGPIGPQVVLAGTCPTPRIWTSVPAERDDGSGATPADDLQDSRDHRFRLHALHLMPGDIILTGTPAGVGH